MAAPTATEIRNKLEGYGITTAVLTDAWIEDCRDNEIIPHIERITRMVFTTASQSVTEYYNGTNKSVIILNRRPVNSITEIRTVGGVSEYNLVNSIELVQAEGIIKIKSNFYENVVQPAFVKGDKNIKVTYTYGYADYPNDVSAAIKNLVAAKMLNHVGSMTGGGDLNVQAHGRSYGEHGKYTHIRKELAATGYALLKPYMTAVTGG